MTLERPLVPVEPGAESTAMPVRGFTAAVVAAVLIVAGGCQTAVAAPPSRSCAQADERLVPVCGVWWGVWPRTDAAGTVRSTLPANLASLEQAVGRRFDLVSRYKGWGEDLYDVWDVGLRDSGHLVLEDLTSRDFRSDTYTSWAQIAAGAHDAYLTRQARRAKAFGARTFLSFGQEPEQALERGNAAGTPEDFAAAYRHVHDLFRAQGATNVVWVWWVMGYSGHNPLYHRLWPGAGFVDWIAYDPYDFNTCHRTAPKTTERTLSSWYRWVDAQPWSAGKPLMLAEFGSNGPDQGAWLAAVPRVLRSLPRIRAAVHFNSRPGRCDHRFTASAANLAGYRQASADPYVNPAHR